MVNHMRFTELKLTKKVKSDLGQQKAKNPTIDDQEVLKSRIHDGAVAKRVTNGQVAAIRHDCEEVTFCAPYGTIHQENNLTAATEFFLMGFQCSQNLRFLLFCLLLVIFLLTICGNLLIITLVSISKNLHNPMYFFITHLSISDILLPTDIVPEMLHILLNNGGSITFIGCMTQFFVFSVSEGFECLLLTVMSYDRYVAICNPLRYTSIMTNECCIKLAATCWFFSFFFTLIETITTSMMTFCGPNIIDHFYCDILYLLDIACSDTSILQLEVTALGTPMVGIPTIIIIVSYVYIIITILRISSRTGRQKAFSTCSSHLIVVSIFYGTLFSVYVLPTRGQTSTISKILSLLYTVFTPLVNPMIYSLRNEDIWKAVQETLLIQRSLHGHIHILSHK
ncbi:olfactory receptor 5G3-like [Rhinoderma darwinii]|uniref:olfactory receptor 5G3-like n=1 Tax=Rhinoderma darwinii TaxID=43563 RepID=UPI003F672250